MVSMPREPPYTRREGDQLARRIDAIDAHGTRGMQTLSDRVGQQSKALEALRKEVHDRFSEHTMQHEAEQALRTSGRRFRVTAGIALAGVCVAILALLVSILGQLPTR